MSFLSPLQLPLLHYYFFFIIQQWSTGAIEHKHDPGVSDSLLPRFTGNYLPFYYLCLTVNTLSRCLQLSPMYCTHCFSAVKHIYRQTSAFYDELPWLLSKQRFCCVLWCETLHVYRYVTQAHTSYQLFVFCHILWISCLL